MKEYEREGYAILIQQADGNYLIGTHDGELKIVDGKYLDEHVANHALQVLPVREQTESLIVTDKGTRAEHILKPHELPDGSTLRCAFAAGIWVVDKEEILKRQWLESIKEPLLLTESKEGQ